MAGADRNFKITFDVDANVAPLKGAIGQIQSAFNKVNIPANFKKGIEDTLSKLTTEITNFESIASKGFKNLGDASKADRSLEKIVNLFSKLKIQTKDIEGIDPNKFLPTETLKKTTELQKAWAKLKEAVENGFDNSAEIKKQTTALEKERKALEDLNTKWEKLQKDQESAVSLSDQLKKDTQAARDLADELDNIAKKRNGRKTNEYITKNAELERLNSSITKNQAAFDKLEDSIRKNSSATANYSERVEGAKSRIETLEKVIEQLKNTTDPTSQKIDELRQKLANINNVDISQIPTDIDEIGTVINKLNDEAFNEITQGILNTKNAINGATPAFEKLEAAEKDASQATRELSERQKDLEQFANRIKYFFSIGNTVMLFRRAVKAAIDTVKELDEVMTQAAVVTKFTVADMWAQLPQYAQRANELGVTIKGVYEASTLYYQQGLETVQVIGVANETLKMAKIAGIDYATATDYMTSALRGFNMEVNELSAQKVNDIYSQLAAKTASNVEEISIAMSKVAPLAHNAGMEIETTAAILAQMIEKTREAPETLGTAMKTVIARFQELKKDPALIEPVDGEIVDANKVETALRTIGVSLRNAEGQFRELDDVFLEISEKWDSLDTNTQRYIATIAAGSRQQSRFIAMMADYSRTTQLVELANNAAGASTVQFNKTQESLATALNRLKVAWDQYTMGLANNEVIKKVIDLITGFINKVNEFTNKLSKGSNTIKSFLDVGVLIAGIKLARATFNTFYNWLFKTGQKTGQQVTDSIKQNFQVISKEARVKAKEIGDDFKRIFKDKGSLNIGDIAREFRKLGPEIQQEILRGAPEIGKVLTEELKRSIDYEGLDEAGKAEADAFIKGQIQALESGKKSLQQVLDEIRNKYANANFTKEISSDSVQTLTKSFSTLSSGINAAGMLLNRFASALDKLGLNTAATAVRGLGNALISLGGVITSLKTLIEATGMAAKVSLGEVIAIVAVVAGLGILIASLIKGIKENSLEGRLESARKSTEQAQKAAEAAEEAYNNLLNTKEEYGETQRALEELTYGTLEWKQALVEANQEVLNLLQNYPELKKYLARGEYGQLIITDEGWKEVSDKQYNTSVRTRGAEAFSELLEYTLQNEKKTNEINKEFEYYDRNAVKKAQKTGEYTGDYDIDIITKKAIETAIDEGVVQNFDKALEKMGTHSELTAEQINKAGEAMLKYKNDTQEVETQMESTARAFLSFGLDSEKTKKLDRLEGASDIIIETFTEEMVKAAKTTGRDTDWEVIASDIYDGVMAPAENEVFQNLAFMYKDKINQLGGMTQDDLHDLQILLAAMLNTTIEAVEEEYGKDKNSIAGKIAELSNSDYIVKAMNDFSENLLNLEDNVQQALLFTMSKGSKFLGKRSEIKDTLENLLENWEFLDEETKKIVIDQFGSKSGLYVAYKEAARQAEENFRQIRVELVQSMLDNGVFKSGKLANYQLNSLSDSQLESFGGIMSQTSSLTQNTQAFLLSSLPTLLKNSEEEINNLFSSIDFSEPIDAFLTLEKTINNTTGATKEIAKELLVTESELFSAGNLFKNLWQSAEFEEVDENLRNIAKDSGKITSANIKELTKSSDKLNKILQTGKVNVTGLAKAFTAYTQAGISLDYFTTRVLKALSATKDFDEVLLDLQEHYNNFDPGIDESFGFNFLSDASKKMQEYAENYQYGNSAFWGYFKEVFGAENLEAVLNGEEESVRETFNNWMNKLQGWLTGDSYGFWYQLAEGVNGEWGKDFGVSFGEQGQILIEAGSKTTEELIDFFSSNTGLPKETVEAFLAQFSAHSLDLKKTLADNDFTAVIQTFVKDLNDGLKNSNIGVISTQEVEALATSTGRTFEQVINIIEEETAGRIKIVDWIDSKTGLAKTGADLWTQIEKSFSKNGKFDIQDFLNTDLNLDIDFDENNVSLDVDKLHSALQDLGLGEEAANSIISNISESLSEALDKKVFFEKTIEVPVTLVGENNEKDIVLEPKVKMAKTLDELEVKINAELEAANYNIIADSIVDQNFSGLATNIEDTIGSAARTAANNLKYQIDSIRFQPKTLDIDIKYNGSNSSGWNGYGTVADFYAKGTPSLPHSETVLAGEEGYELAYDSHGAFVLGANGPEITDLEKGTVIYPHDISKKILKGQTKKHFPNYANGTSMPSGEWATSQMSETTDFYGLAQNMESIANSAEDVTEEIEKWENPYDWLYNLTQKINAELRIRDKLERRYQRLLKTYSGTGEDLKRIVDQELASLEKRKQYEQEMIKLRRQELKEYLAANAALAKYATIDWELEVVRIDWNQINAVTDPEQGEAIEKYISKLEELIDYIRNAEDAIDDIDDEIIDLKQRGRDEYRDLEDRVLDALISQQQDIIDEQERIYDAINDAASDLVNAISNNIEKLRQDRQNEETETSLAEKERRLAYLRQDTTGSNALEIKKLEEDLDKEKQNYTDALIDQSLNDLKEQNDHAAEQREKQIELMQSTLDWQQQTGYWVDEATRIVREGIGPNGMLTEDSELYRLLFKQEQVASMSNASQAWWLDNLKNTVAQAYLYLENALKPAETGATSSVSDRDIMADIRAQAATGRANNSGMSELQSLENERNAKIDRLGVEDTWNKTRMVENYNKGYNEYNNSTDGKTDWMAKINEELAKETPVWDNAFYYAGKRDAKLKTLNDSGASSIYSSDFTFEIVLEKWYEATKSHTYKTGGLADFTGPAWLDGSKSKPEMVLNARDTENFLQLKDILSNLRMSFSGSKGALGGDWYFDIDINVGEIASDYDVDQLTERVKQSIYTESTYRNVNAINFLK